MFNHSGHTHGAPADVIKTLEMYVNHRIPTGGFLRAVLANDLKEACAHADGFNRHKLFEIVSFCYNEIPYTCWGSYEKVNAWLENQEQ